LSSRARRRAPRPAFPRRACRGRRTGARSLLFLTPLLLRDPLLECGHGRRPPTHCAFLGGVMGVSWPRTPGPGMAPRRPAPTWRRRGRSSWRRAPG
jgi:hypothetical protein